MISLYQGQIYPFSLSNWLILFHVGAAIMIMSLVLFENEFLHIVSISFTALILNELIMVALEITTWCACLFIAVTSLIPYLIGIFI